jgi:CheY-like chemotaxis protein/HPt (histidine-containing phosphotransfer) domain-containing protein
MMGQMSKTLTIAIVADDQLASLIQNELKCSAHALKGLALNFACSQLAHRALVLEQACVSRETVPRLQALLFEAQASARAVAQRVDGRRDLLGENGLLDVLEMDSNNNRSTDGGSDLGNCSPLSVSLTTSPIATYSTLAAHWEPTERRGSKADAERPPTDVYSSPNTADVLLVEDSALARKFVTKLFKAKNLSFECSADGTEAVDRIRRGERFTVILMDKEMPGLGGVEATVSIRQLEEGVPMHIIGLTGNEDAATRAQFLQAGADGVVIKPLTAGVLDQVMLRRS